MAVATDVKHNKESDGRSVTIDLSYTVVARQPAFGGGWLGITVGAGDSGEQVALEIFGEYQFKVPSGLSVAAGEIVRIDTTDLTGHTPDDTAYNKNAESSTNRNFFRATSAKDSNNIVTGILLTGS